MKIKTNKLIAILAIITMLLGIVSFNNVSMATSADVKNISVSSVSGKVGDKVTIDIKATADWAIEDDGLLLKYDSSKLKFVSSTDATVASLMIMSGNKSEGVVIGMVATGADKTPVKKGTVICSVTFEILEAASGKVELELVHEYETPQPTLAKATVTVTKNVTGVTLNKTTLNLEKGQTETLVATVKPADHTESTKVSKWETSNASVAKVDKNGKVTAVGTGKATITYTFNNYKATCTVNVSTPLKGISLNETSKELLKGQTLDLKVTCNPADADNIPATTWKSSNPEVATVTNGKVVAVKAGTAKITATVGTLTAECNVTVKEIPLNSISLDQADFELNKGKSKTLKVIFNPENTTDDISKVEWSSSDNTVVSVKDGKVTALKVGEATITAKVGGKEASVKITVPEVLIEGIKLVVDKTTLKIGETTEFSVETTPAEVTEEFNAVYTSSDETVLTIDGETGEITALKAGTATISVNVNGRFTAEVEIEVSEEIFEEEVEEDKEDEKSDLHQTGDIAIEIMAALMIISTASIAFIVIKRRKNNK